jgi:hypothetical protein
VIPPPELSISTSFRAVAAHRPHPTGHRQYSGVKRWTRGFFSEHTTPIGAATSRQETIMSRTPLDPATAANRLVRQLLATLLAEAPRAAVVSLSTHGADDRQWDMVCHVAKGVGQSRRFDLLARCIPPVPEWEAHLSALRAGHCPVLRTSASSTLFCPAIDPQGDLLGAVLIGLGEGNQLVCGAELRQLLAAAVSVARQIAAVLDIVRRATEPVASLAAA